MSLTIWGIIAIHIVVLLATQLPPVQSWLGSKASVLLSEALGTRATVGRVGVGLSGRFVIDDVTIPDLHGDTLLRVGRLSVKAELLQLLNGNIDISSAQLFGAHVRLRQAHGDTPANWQFVIDALASPDTTDSKPLQMHIGSLIVRRSSLTYTADAQTTDGQRQADAATVAVSDISTHIMLKNLTPDSLSINVKRLSLHEQAGLSIEDFTARLTAGPNAAQLHGLRLQLPNSFLAADTVAATYSLDLPTPPRITADTGRRFMESLRYHAVVGHAAITPSDLEPLIHYGVVGCQPSVLKAMPCLTLSAALSGTGKEAVCRRLSIGTTDGDLELDATGWLRGDSLANASWHLDLSRLNVTAGLLTSLKEAFPAIPDELLRLGNVSLTATASRQPDGQTDCQALAGTGIGNASLLFSMDSSGTLAGHIATDSLHLGRLLGNDDLGHTAATADVSGTKELMEATATVNSLLFKGHSYRNITATAAYQPQTGSLSATVTADDPSLMASADVSIAGLHLGQRQPADGSGPQSLKARADIAHMRPADLGLSGKWGDATFSASIDAGISGTTLADASGYLQIDDCTMHISADSALCLTDHLTVKSDIYDGQRLTVLSSDIADGELTGQQDLAMLTKDFSLRLLLKDARWASPLLGIPLRPDHCIMLTAATAAADSTASTGHSSIVTSLAWGDAPAAGTDTLQTTEGRLNAVARLYEDGQGRTETHIDVKPSHVMIAATPWLIHPSALTYHDGYLNVDSFAVSNGSLHLIVDGTASASQTDTLTIDMSGLDVAYIQDLLDFHPVDFGGLLSGKAYATSLFASPDQPQAATPSAWANVQVDSFLFQDGRMGTLRANVKWNTGKKQIDIDAVADDGPTARTLIKGYVSPVRSDIALNIRAEGSNIEFCRSFTDGFLSDLSGAARGALMLEGPLGGMNLTGMLTVDGQMTVKALNTTYTLTDDTLLFVPNDIRLHRVDIADRDGNTATLNGGIHHQELSDFTFDIDVRADRVLVYDFPTFDGSNICGTVRADGNADIHVRPGEVTINCNLTPQPGSIFAYNAANPDAVSRQEFITWGKPAEGESHDTGRKPADTAASQAEEAQPTPTQTEAPGGSTDLIINFLINATPDATMRILMDAATGDYITLNGEGTLRAAYHDKGPFHLFGTYNVNHGTYGITIQNIIKKSFTFQPQGTIVFGGDPYEATLNLQAVHTVNGVSLSDLNIGSSFASSTVRVNCLMNITGTPAQPRVDFDLELPTVNSEENQMIRSLIASEQEMNQQVLYLLGIGRFYTQGANNASAQQYGQTTLAMQSFLSGTISTQINEVLSQVIKSNDWNFGANISTGDEGWNNAEYEGMVSGRLLNNRLLINGQFGYRDRAATATPSFIGDFDLQYLLKSNGNLAVKVYNQTNDRYFTRSSLNTQGVGIVMKKDFDGLADLLRRKNRQKKDKEDNKEKQ